jgi:triacylglycerol lipase
MTSWSDLLRPGDATDFFTRVSPWPAFDPTAAAFSEANALWLMELSRLVYRHDVEEQSPPPSPTRASLLQRAGLRQHTFFQDAATDTQAMIVEAIDRSFAVLVFRGTEDPRDFEEDLRAKSKPVHDSAARVHDGFDECFESVWPAIDTALNTVARPVFYTGHSLGAALATLAARERPPRAQYTFGSPRVGNEAFASALSAAIVAFRIVDDRDVVTILPPELIGYAHAGVRVPLSASWTSWLAVPPLQPIKPLADHAPVNYIDRMGTAAPEIVAPPAI